ncbi:MAG: T9SS C-terminal target domain-containing protein [Porphyromonadaceae bacterium]|nr:MAG: T9SS C-terminal target domain-containing protein [Porphyromonadaceae bacterium]
MKKASFFLLSSMVVAVVTFFLAGCQKNNKIENEEAGKFPNDWFYRQRAYPYTELRSDLYYKAMEQTLAMEKNGLKSGQESWTLVGPVNIGGRITDIEMPATDKNTIYLGSASGGIFKSTNLGTNWTPIFDNAVALSIGDMDIAKTNPDILFVGTGEPNAGGGSHTYEGYGVYKSLDAGGTWIHCGLTSVGSIGRVKIDPLNPDTVYVAAMGHLFSYNAERGIFRTKDGGTTWEKILYLNDSTGASDLCINPQNSKILYAAMWERTRRPPYQSYGGKTSGLWRSVDGGDTWSELLNGLPKGDVGRIGIDISDSNPSALYATYTDSTGYLNGIYKTTNGGDNWSKTAELGENSSYWWWFSEIDVDPINPNIAYVSGLQAYKTTNGGTTWTNTFSSAHVDMHGVFVHPKDNALSLLCSDGGLYVSKFAGATSFHIENLPITQFYTCEVDYLNPDRYYGGTQDNGTIRVTNGMINRWQSIYGGDGFVVKVDPTDNNYVYAQYQYGGLGRSIDGASSFLGGTQGISGGDRMNWKSPLELDPQNPSILYFGSNRLYKSTNRAQSWRPVSSDLTNGPGVNVNYGTLTTISVSPLDANIIYVGTDDGNVWNTLNGTTTWTNISTNLPDRWITCVQTSSFDKAVAFVTISGYRWDSYLPHVYRTSNNGQTWEDISGNLPDFPVNSIVLDPVIKDTWYIGTDGGVFITRNGGITWEIYGTGLPKVAVLDLYLHAPTRMLTAATFGRSMYTIPLPAAEGTNPIANSQIDIKAYPNPFNTQLQVTFSFNQNMAGELSAYDMSGKQVKVLHQGSFTVGENRFTWAGDDENQNPVAPGSYLIRLVTNKSISAIRVQKI